MHAVLSHTALRRSSPSAFSVPAATAPGTARTRQRDALIVSLLAYAGLRPGEMRALCLADIHEGTIHVQRAADPDGRVKPLAQDVREYRLAIGRPPDPTVLLGDESGHPWDKTAWQIWRADRWMPACRAAGLDPLPRPYDLRHSFASLLLAEGRQPLYVARQPGHSLPVLFSTYAHLFDEYGERSQPVDGEAEIANSRATSCASEVRHSAN